MNKIKKGDIVTRKSYNEDIYFFVERIIKGKYKKEFAILKGITLRIEADSPISDLIKIKNNRYKVIINDYNKKILNKIIDNRYMTTGRILHLDGDSRYAEKSNRYYKRLGLNAIVKNIAEYKQPQYVYKFLLKYNPDILVITGHDRIVKK